MAILGTLRAGDPGPSGYLRPDRSQRIDGFLYAGDGFYLRPYGRPAPDAVAGSSFPAQFDGLRYFDGVVRDLCLVALADAPPGPQLRIAKGGTTYAAYLVDTTDPNASTIRIRAGAVKAIRLKT